MRAVYLCESESAWRRVYYEECKKRLCEAFVLEDKPYKKSDLGKTDFSDAEVVFSTWGMPTLDISETERYFPSLKAVFYAAGSVRAFAAPFLQKGIRIFSAWQANAVPVAEYAVAQIILANKGFYSASSRMKSDYADAQENFSHYKGNYGAKVGILGDGAIGSQVIERLKATNSDIYVYSIDMTEREAKDKGVRLASLREIFSCCDVISNHLADNEQTRKIINRELIDCMRDYTTLINTGRGAQIDEIALTEKLRSNPTVTAVLDVTYPEPPEQGSELYALPNAVLTSHIAGSSGNEVRRMADYMYDEAIRFLRGEFCMYEVTEKMLRTMA